MKKAIMLLILACFTGSTVKPNIYLWEQTTEFGRSCCLHFDGADICNPDTPCEHYMEGDLVGILEYASRLLSTERGTIQPYHTDLVQVRSYIRKALTSPYYGISYKLDQHRSVRFYHELIDAAMKSKDKGGARGQAAKNPGKNKDVVIEYLTKLGLFVPYEKKDVI